MSSNQPPPYPDGSNPPNAPTYGDPTPPPSEGYPPAGGYPPPGSYPPAPGGYGGAPQGNKKALWSMIVGIASLALGLFCGFLIIGSIVAIVLGFVARSEINRSNGAQTGSGQALTGIITGFVMVALFILAVILLATGVVDYDFTRA
ncbi:MAG: hypothetical protein JWR55_1152 [Aeromicrobium sp.]|jgi:hypothetical protein|nr:hypothetical protein [Aeromicrobium sp.]